jgi:hypothetical protein
MFVSLIPLGFSIVVHRDDSEWIVDRITAVVSAAGEKMTAERRQQI